MAFNALPLCLQPDEQQKLHLSAKQLSLFTIDTALCASFGCLPFLAVLALAVSVLLAEMLSADVLLIAAIAVIMDAAGHDFELVAGVLRVIEALLAEARIAYFAVEASIV